MAGPSPSSSNLSQNIDPSRSDSASVYPASQSYPPPPVPVPSSGDSAGGVSSIAKPEKGLALYACGHCGRRYSRPEHLQRHVQTHTLGRRFACSICGKTFARADLKKRHETNHENDDTKKRRRTTSLNTGRVTHACKACATARVKCQEEKPCQRCVRRGLTCVSSEASSSAAMNLVHLSASARSKTPVDDEHDSSNASAEYAPTSFPNPTSYPTDQPSLYGQNAHFHAHSRSATPNTGDLPPSSEAGSSSQAGTDQLPFCDFLRDVLYEQQYDQSARIPENQGLAVLNFCNDSNMELSDMDFGLLDHWNTDGMANSAPVQQETPKSPVDMDHMRQNLVTAWDVSPWRWDPVANDNAFGEQGNLPVSKRDVASIQAQASKGGFRRVVDQKLDFAARDGVLALVLGACQPDTMSSRISGSFPSADLLDTMLHVFLNSHTNQVSDYIHFPTFKLNEQEPEWIAGAAAAGAVLIPIPTLRKFGYALQESIRMYYQFGSSSCL